VTKAFAQGQEAGDNHGTARRGFHRAAHFLMPLTMFLATGCMTGADWSLNPTKWWSKAPEPTPAAPADSLVLRGDHLEPDKTVDSKDFTELAGAKELYRRGDYPAAELIFTKVADNKKNPAPLAEEARYYEADCLRLQMHYPRAADTYKKCLDDFPSGLRHDEANKRMFDIANFWLDETRKEMEASQKKEAKPWHILPTGFVHFEKEKPLLDMEGRALEILEYVHINDPVGPLGEKALFYLGSVKFFREDYREADHYFNQIVNTRPNSSMAPKALELCIIAKQMSTGGPEYDGRKCQEARQLIDTALRNYPELANQKHEFLERQVWSINQQEAARDFSVAEFYQRTGHPGAAYFYFELVRRRYPGSKYAKDAVARKEEVRAKMDAEQARVAAQPKIAPPVAAAAPPAAPAHPFLPPIPQWSRPAAPPAPAPVETAPQPRPVEFGSPTPPETAPAPRPLPGQGNGG
jgi:outer membrane protein assembly factor BamD (BamD/ComL family)